MRSNAIVVLAPLLDHDLDFPQRVEDLAVQQLVTQLAIERLAVAILPRAALRDVKRRRAHATEPPAQLLGHHLGPVVAASVLGHPTLDHHVGEDIDHVL